MQYVKSEKYQTPHYFAKIMGPNPIKLEEELLLNAAIDGKDTVMDLGSGQGLTSVFLVKEYGCRVFATDLWSDPSENMRFFESEGLNGNRIIPIKADAVDLPYAKEFFDAVVCTDSYNYFGRDKSFLGEKLLPYVKRGGYIYIAVPGMKKDLHSALPQALLTSWTAEQLDYIHDKDYWCDIIGATEGIEFSVKEMEGNLELWKDWIACDNEYAANDKKAVEAGACDYLNFLAIVIKRL